MECKNARLMLEVAHPLATELDPRDTAELANHLADCPDCGPWAESERRVDEYFGQAIRDVAVPDGLSQRLLRRLNVERDACYRAWLVRAVGVAAVLLLAFWVGWAAWWSKVPPVDLQKLHVDRMLHNAELVEQAFADDGVTMKAPRGFDYNYLQSCNMAVFQGKQVPLLLFVRSGPQGMPAVAEVYVLSSRQFDIEELKKTSQLAGSRKNIEVLANDRYPDYVYVVVFPVTTNFREAFIKHAKADT